MKTQTQLHNKQTRFQFLDFTRGVALVLMFIYHLCFGLSQLGYLEIHFSTDIFWISFRALIVFLFLSLVGIGLYLATLNRFNVKGYVKRLLLLFCYFTAITLLSQFVRPDFTVYFGILHLIFVSSLFGILFVRFKYLNLILGVTIVLLGLIYQSHYFDSIYLSWIGFSYTLPTSDDFAPIFPWFGIVLIGIYCGHYFFSTKTHQTLLNWKANVWPSRLLIWAGKHSIHLYFIHFQTFYILVYIFD